MNLLLTAATEMEITATLDFLKKEYKQLGADLFFNEKNKIQVLCTGVGMLATCFQLTKVLSEKNFDLVVQAGIAGTYDSSVELGALFSISSETLGDLGAEDHYAFLDVFELGLNDRNDFPFSEGSLVKPSDNFPFRVPLKSLTSLTVNTASGSDITVEKRYKKYGCSIETMEGAALHYVCLQKGIPFIQIRSISNYVEARDKSKWKIKEALKTLNDYLIRELA